MIHNVYIYISDEDVADLRYLKVNDEDWLEDLPFDICEGVHEVSLSRAIKWRDQVDPAVFDQYDDPFGLKMSAFHFAIY